TYRRPPRPQTTCFVFESIIAATTTSSSRSSSSESEFSSFPSELLQANTQLRRYFDVPLLVVVSAHLIVFITALTTIPIRIWGSMNAVLWQLLRISPCLLYVGLLFLEGKRTYLSRSA